MSWFEDKFNNRYGGVKRTHLPRGFVKREPLFSISLTGKIIILNVILFFIYTLFILFINEETLLENLALKPSNIFEGKKLWTIFTHFFLHASLTHLAMNMISLIFIGNFVEKLIGRKRFLYFYLLGGIFSAFSFLITSSIVGNNAFLMRIFSSPNVYAVGASGAIFALGGLLAILTPKLRVLVFFILPMPLWIGLIFLLSFFWFLSIIGGFPIGNSAHLGGFLFGVLYGFYLKNKYPNKTRMIREMFS